MDCKKYIGMDVHQATISIAVMDEAGKVVMDSVIETKARTILEFIQGLQGALWVAFEEGTSAAWLYDLLKPYVAKVVVCDPRKNALLKAGNKNDRIDARKLADLLRVGLLSPVYHGESGVRMLKELARSYLTITKDLTRVRNRIKGLYRSWAIPCAGQKVYSPRHRTAWLKQLPESGVQRRAARLYQQLDVARGGSPRVVGREPEAPGEHPSATDSLAGSHPRRSADCLSPNALPFSYQTATMGLQWLGIANPRQRGIPLGWRSTAAC